MWRECGRKPCSFFFFSCRGITHVEFSCQGCGDGGLDRGSDQNDIEYTCVVMMDNQAGVSPRPRSRWCRDRLERMYASR